MLADRIRQIIAEHHGVAIFDLTADTDFFSDLDDSLDLAEIVMACEEEFAISIPDAESASLHTVGDLIACVQGHLPTPPDVWPPPPTC